MYSKSTMSKDRKCLIKYLNPLKISNHNIFKLKNNTVWTLHQYKSMINYNLKLNKTTQTKIRHKKNLINK
jgi:hypothetical protein